MNDKFYTKLQHTLERLLFSFFLKNFLGARTEEDRATYERGEAKSKDPQPCIGFCIDNDVIFFKGMRACVEEFVNREMNAIGECKRRQFLKLCETLGFPAQCCNLDDLENSFISLIDYICDLSNELMKATEPSQTFVFKFNRYTEIWKIFDDVNAIVEFFHVIKKYPEFEKKFKKVLRVDDVGSAKYRAMKLRASITHLQPETDCAKLAAILREILGEFRSICGGGIWEECKFGCLHVMVPVLTRFRIDPRSKALPDNIQEMVAKVVKYMFDFGKEIIHHSNDYDYTSNFEGYHCTVLPKNRKELQQFLLDNLGK